MTRPGRLWAALAALLALGSVLCASLVDAPAALDWQPARAWAEPWRWWTAAWVHWTPRHLAANLAGAAVLAALGLAARLPARAAAAWALAWPLTQLGLLARPDLARFGGLSGVLHAGVAIAALYLVLQESGPRRAIGAAIGVGLLVKVGLEGPWGPALRHWPEWDLAVAPASHASGLLAGVLAGLLVGLTARAFVSSPTQAETKPDTIPIDTAHPP